MQKILSGEIEQDECFAEQAHIWLILIAIVVGGVILFSIINLNTKGQKDKHHAHGLQHDSLTVPTTPNAALQGVKLVALRPCPYCRGVIDNRGRCNMPGCRLYAPPVYAPPSHPARRAALNFNIMQQARYICPLCGMGRGAPLAPCPRCGFTIDTAAMLETAPQATGTGNAGASARKKYLCKELAMQIAALDGYPAVSIFDVFKGGRAETAGLRRGDVIVKFNGKDTKTVKDFIGAVASAGPETTVKMQIIRNGKKINLNIFVGEGEMEGVIIPATFQPAANPWGVRR